MLTVDLVSELSHHVGRVWIAIEVVMLPVALGLVWRIRSYVADHGWAQELLEGMILLGVGRLLFTILIVAWELAGAPVEWLPTVVLARGARTLPLLVFPLAVVLPTHLWRRMLALCGALMAAGTMGAVWMLLAL